MKYQILRSQYIQINGTNRLPLKVYKIIALRTFEVLIKGHKSNDYNDKIVVVKEGDIGGYIQNEENLPQNDASWVFNTACVFEGAKLVDSVVLDSAKVCDHSKVNNSTILGRSRVFGKSNVTDSVILDNSDVSESSEIVNSYLYNASKVNGNSKVKNSKLSIGSRVNKGSTIIDCELSDQSEVTDKAVCTNCFYSGQTFIKGGTHINETLKQEIQLDIVSVADPTRILDF